MATVSLCLFLALTTQPLVSGLNDVRCPDRQVDKCFCEDYSFMFRGPFLSCVQIKDEDDLWGRIEVLKDNPVSALQLHNVALQYLPRGIFSNTNIQTLWLSSSDFEYIAPPDLKGPSPFLGLEDSVTEIRIEGMNHLVNMDWSEFANLKKLSKITLYYINLKEIDESFSNLPRTFQTFEVHDGRINRIAPGAFELEGLTEVSLQHNMIERLDRNIFGNNGMLTTITFSNNQLKEVSDDFFDGLPAVYSISLGQNQLTRLPSSLKTNWAQYQTIYLSGNPLVCDCSLVWLLKLAKSQPPMYSDLEFINCGSPSRLAGRELLTLNETDLCS